MQWSTGPLLFLSKRIAKHISIEGDQNILSLKYITWAYWQFWSKGTWDMEVLSALSLPSKKWGLNFHWEGCPLCTKNRTFLSQGTDTILLICTDFPNHPYYHLVSFWYFLISPHDLLSLSHFSFLLSQLHNSLFWVFVVVQVIYMPYFFGGILVFLGSCLHHIKYQYK